MLMNPRILTVAKSLVSLGLLCVTTVLADFSCDWHEANDFPPDFAHYDAKHDYDGIGFGCPLITGFAPEPVLTDAELDALFDVGVGENDAPHPPTPRQRRPRPAVPSVELLANSNFRRGPGLAFVIVGGGASGSVYQWTQAQYGSGGYIWYELVLPAGAGWVRGDLITLLDMQTQINPVTLDA